ncbi:MAG: hypothetical protein SF052_12650 [Bacteroidia bacterium]|nr:hypothetical protein [Bacteroidia bacterium]
MNRKLIFFALVLTTVFVACTVKPGSTSESGDESPYGKLMAEVMAIHDEVMPQMSKLYELKKSLGEKTETLSDSETDKELRTKIEAATQSLEKADEGMMNWMRNFEDPGENDPEKAVAYLQKEKEKVLEVKKQMLESIQTAEQILQ